MRVEIFFIVLLMSFSAVQARVIISHTDNARDLKRELLFEMMEIMNGNGAIQYVLNHEKVILWTNQAPVLGSVERGFRLTTLPSFTPASNSNKEHLQDIILGQTGELIDLEKIGGVLIGSPFIAAQMFFRRGYLNKSENSTDGVVAPLVILYHEFSHARDSLQFPHYFNDLAAQFDTRYKNGAERMAVQSQNDFLMTAKSKGIDLGQLRRSYGRNKLIQVDGPYTVPVIED